MIIAILVAILLIELVIFFGYSVIATEREKRKTREEERRDQQHRRLYGETRMDWYARTYDR